MEKNKELQNELLVVAENEISPLTQITKAELDIQISTAKHYPRSIQSFRQDAMSMATIDTGTAASCFYKLKRKDKDGGSTFIEGPSVRLAEIIASAWGNIRFGARIIAEDERFVIAQGVAHDLEKNVSNTIEVSRRITNKNNIRYSDDMISVTKNAACSIALRNAIFKTIPFTYANQVYEQAKKVAIGSAKTLTERKKSMLDLFSKMGVTVQEITDFLELKNIEDIGLKEVETMIGVFTAIKDGDTTIDEQFGRKKKADVEMPQSKSAPAPKQTPPPTLKENGYKLMLEEFASMKKQIGDKIYYEVLKESGYKHANEIKDMETGRLILIEMGENVDIEADISEANHYDR